MMTPFKTFALSLIILPLAMPSSSGASGGAAGDAKTTAIESGPILESSLDELAQSVGIETARNENAALGRPLKIAILDDGFRGFKSALGAAIPRTTKLRLGPIAMDPEKEEEHGLKMAEILSNLLERTETKFDLHLFQTFGYSNFKSAIDTVIAEKFDIVLYSKVWEYSGFGDGRGFINPLVSKATDRGILWVNAAGNFAKGTYIAPVERVDDDWAYLPGPNQSVQIRCHRSSSKSCSVSVTLSWNSFSDDVTIGTDKDLDLVLTDDTLKVVATAGLLQKRTSKGELGVSLYPREILKADLAPGLYFARVKVRSNNFTKADSLRLTVSGDFVELLNRSEGETILAPADNPSVISVGASDSDNSSYSRINSLPHLRAKSLLKTENDLQFKGSSNSAAAMAARIAVEVYQRGPLTRDAALRVLRGSSPAAPPSPAVPNSAITEIAPPRGHCYPFQVLRLNPHHIMRMIQDGGHFVETTSGFKIFIDEDPFARAARLGLPISDDGTGREILLADRAGLFSSPKSSRALLGGDGTIEIVKTPANVSFCR